MRATWCDQPTPPKSASQPTTRAVVVEQDQPQIALARVQEAVHDLGVEHVLVEERPVALGDAQEELGDELEVVGADGAQVHGDAPT